METVSPGAGAFGPVRVIVLPRTGGVVSSCTLTTVNSAEKSKLCEFGPLAPEGDLMVVPPTW